MKIWFTKQQALRKVNADGCFSYKYRDRDGQVQTGTIHAMNDNDICNCGYRMDGRSRNHLMSTKTPKKEACIGRVRMISFLYEVKDCN